MLTIAIIKFVNAYKPVIYLSEDLNMTSRPAPFLSELPEAPLYDPLRDALAATIDPKVSAALQRFASMPRSTGVMANPVRHHCKVKCGTEPVELSIRSFGIRGCLLEEDIVTGAVDSTRTIFVGLFGRFPRNTELRAFLRLLSGAFDFAQDRVLPALAKFMSMFPCATADVAMQYIAVVRKTAKKPTAINSRPSADLLRELIDVHMENVAAAASSSYMRALSQGSKISHGKLLQQTRKFLDATKASDPFSTVFSLLLRRPINALEEQILQTLGTIQIHHGSAGSNMVTRYLASLHTRSVSDIFTTGQMTLDCARHFGAINDMTDFIAKLDHEPPSRQDQIIRQRAVSGSLPTFGHPEIAAAGRNNQIELDPRPAIYLFPLLEAIHSGGLEISPERRRRVTIAQRMYQIAFVEGIEKPGRPGRLRIAPNTDFGAWIVQETLGIDPEDRTLLSYVFRGFGWMMDVREQLQQPIIRPVIPPEPGIIPAPTEERVIPSMVVMVHNSLSGESAFAPFQPGC
jgi:citrate synthase